MSKVEVFKDSKGNLFENERDYVLSESAIKKERILKNWEMLTNVIESDPPFWYHFIYEIGKDVLDGGYTKERLQAEYEENRDLFKKEKKYGFTSHNDVEFDGGAQEKEPFLWGNDTLDGDWISEQ